MKTARHFQNRVRVKKIFRSPWGIGACLLLFLLSFPCQNGLSASKGSPLNQVQETVDYIVGILKSNADASPEMLEKNRDDIMAAVERRFDFREMSQRTLASYWRKINDQQKDNFVVLFSKLLEKSYIVKIEGYSDEKVLFKAEEIRNNKAVVETGILRNNIEIPIVYRLKKNNGDWLVYDVVIEGVSLIRNYRTQFQSIISKGDYDGLIKRMEEKIAKSEEEQ